MTSFIEQDTASASSLLDALPVAYKIFDPVPVVDPASVCKLTMALAFRYRAYLGRDRISDPISSVGSDPHIYFSFGSILARWYFAANFHQASFVADSIVSDVERGNATASLLLVWRCVASLLARVGLSTSSCQPLISSRCQPQPPPFALVRPCPAETTTGACASALGEIVCFLLLGSHFY